MLKAAGKHIRQFGAVILLIIFAIALTPFDFFHNHAVDSSSSCYKGQVKCSHKEHIKSTAETCLICALHFEKTYFCNQYYFQVFLKKKAAVPHFYKTLSSYTELVGTSLRGPPLS